MKIHPSAIIDPAARLAEGVEVGPFSWIGPEVQVGPGSVVQSHVVLEGSVRLGAENRIGPGTIIGGWPQDLRFQPETNSSVEIGDRNVIREHVTIHRGTDPGSVTRMGHDNFLMAGAHLGHNCTVGDKVIIANNCLLGGHVVIEDQVFLGGGSVFHQFVRIGRLAITQGNSGFGKDLPPFVAGSGVNKAVGLNVVGMRRAGLSADERGELRVAFRLLYESGLNLGQALARAGEQKWQAPAQHFFAFVAAAKRRGICALRRRRDRGGAS